MPLELKKVGTSAVYGLVDIGTEIADGQLGYTSSFQTITDWQRTAAFVGGSAAAHLTNGSLADYGETVAYASLPLFEKSVYKAVRQYLAPTLPAIAGYSGGRGQPGQIVLRQAGRPGSAPVAVVSKTY